MKVGRIWVGTGWNYPQWTRKSNGAQTTVVTAQLPVPVRLWNLPGTDVNPSDFENKVLISECEVVVPVN